MRLHLVVATNTGLGGDEITETFIHPACYAGCPAGFAELTIASELFDSLDAQPEPGAGNR